MCVHYLLQLTEDVVDDAFSDILLHKILLGLVLHTAALLFSAALRRPLRSIDIDILEGIIVVVYLSVLS